jgi:hypothetical protein
MDRLQFIYVEVATKKNHDNAFVRTEIYNYVDGEVAEYLSSIDLMAMKHSC